MIVSIAHHPWCNLFTRPRKGCEMCRELFNKYPIEAGDQTGDLLRRHFPQNVEVS